MSYAHSLLIVDDEGEVVIEHQLTPDEAVKILADALASKPAQAEAPPATVVPQKRKYKKKGKKEASPKPHEESRQPCPECGSSRRHFKHCSFNGKPKRSMHTTELSEGIPMTAELYEALRDRMQHSSFSSLTFASQNKIRPREVNLALKSVSYLDYMESR